MDGAADLVGHGSGSLAHVRVVENQEAQQKFREKVLRLPYTDTTETIHQVIGAHRTCEFKKMGMCLTQVATRSSGRLRLTPVIELDQRVCRIDWRHYGDCAIRWSWGPPPHR